ncbi:hypothetical protein [Desulforamulus aquiferis]|uniref:Uncharacterized protein n=1 Tax=Desulforamulus aquiferis TaxID=1397668 RepID=A0AAW7ZCT7_9FIRM|nr:hypothetical protein [Desulforamulus aquiferis]MDO7786974.1 hypothetical protein [Desulforamulus aquiferis]RYD03877.1 hypothetical protein N752_17500 [Desulforamulus aquiferis]
MKKVLFPLLGAAYLGISFIGQRLYRLLYDEETKDGNIHIEICRPWERRQGYHPHHNSF